MGLLDGKVALITGGARGQGRSHALTLAREGADVVLVDIADQISQVPFPMGTQEDLDETVRSVEELDRRAIAVRGDVRSQSDMDEAVRVGIEQLGAIDILVANAGIFIAGQRFWEISEDDWNVVNGVNLAGVWRSAKAVAPHMVERQRGAIVMTSSIYGLEADANCAHYIAAKHGVIGLMRSVAIELAPFDIRCNAVCPGPMDTLMLNNAWQYSQWLGLDIPDGDWQSKREIAYDAVRNFYLLHDRSMLPPSAVSNAILWLVSDEAENITGVALPIDAGHMILPGYNPNPTR